MTENERPRPICFMIMPFNKKKTDSKDGPAEVDFDRLWSEAIFPAVDALGYEAVRADQDVGAMIITDMIERLALSDLVMADVSIANANVYYEIGVRHAAKRAGCVLIGAGWSKPVFDLAQMRRIPYELTDGSVPDAQAQAIKAFLIEQIPKYINSPTPVYSLEGYPNIPLARAAVFRDFVKNLSEFQARVKAIRLCPEDQAKVKTTELLADSFPAGRPVIPSMALEMVYLLRDCVGWAGMLDFIATLPQALRDLDVIQEQRLLALSEAGNPLEAIAGLQQLIDTLGETSERRGLIGGRYKRLASDANLSDQNQKTNLNKAIENYELGMYCDLNDYYPSSNLPRLYKKRNKPGDLDRARLVASVVVTACERAKRRNVNSEWLRSTLIGAAFDSCNVAKAQEILSDVIDEGLAAWKMKTTIVDLRLSTSQCTDPTAQKGLQAVLDQLETLLKNA